MTPDELAKIHAAAFPDPQAWSKAAFASLLSQTGVILCGDVRSFGLLRVTLDEAEVLTLATHPGYRRLGLARAVLKAGEASAASTGANSVFLEVAEDNSAAHQLYAHAGYKQVGSRPRYYQRKDASPIAALVLSKRLGNA